MKCKLISLIVSLILVVNFSEQYGHGGSYSGSFSSASAGAQASAFSGSGLKSFPNSGALSVFPAKSYASAGSYAGAGAFAGSNSGAFSGAASGTLAGSNTGSLSGSGSKSLINSGTGALSGSETGKIASIGNNGAGTLSGSGASTGSYTGSFNSGSGTGSSNKDSSGANNSDSYDDGSYHPTNEDSGSDYTDSGSDSSNSGSSNNSGLNSGNYISSEGSSSNVLSKSGSCCKGPFPGPSGSIHDSKPASSVSGSFIANKPSIGGSPCASGNCGNGQFVVSNTGSPCTSGNCGGQFGVSSGSVPSSATPCASGNCGNGQFGVPSGSVPSSATPCASGNCGNGQFGVPSGNNKPSGANPCSSGNCNGQFGVPTGNKPFGGSSCTSGNCAGGSYNGAFTGNQASSGSNAQSGSASTHGYHIPQHQVVSGISTDTSSIGGGNSYHSGTTYGSTGSQPGSNVYNTQGVSSSNVIGCCKGPFPGPKGSIHDSKPASSATFNPSLSAPQTQYNAQFPGPSGSIFNSKPTTIGSLVTGSVATNTGTTYSGTFPGSPGSIHDSKPVKPVGQVSYPSSTVGSTSTVLGQTNKPFTSYIPAPSGVPSQFGPTSVGSVNNENLVGQKTDGTSTSSGLGHIVPISTPIYTTTYSGTKGSTSQANLQGTAQQTSIIGVNSNTESNGFAIGQVNIQKPSGVVSSDHPKVAYVGIDESQTQNYNNQDKGFATGGVNIQKNPTPVVKPSYTSSVAGSGADSASISSTSNIIVPSNSNNGGVGTVGILDQKPLIAPKPSYVTSLDETTSNSQNGNKQDSGFATGSVTIQKTPTTFVSPISGSDSASGSSTFNGGYNSNSGASGSTAANEFSTGQVSIKKPEDTPISSKPTYGNQIDNNGQGSGFATGSVTIQKNPNLISTPVSGSSINADSNSAISPPGTLQGSLNQGSYTGGNANAASTSGFATGQILIQKPGSTSYSTPSVNGGGFYNSGAANAHNYDGHAGNTGAITCQLCQKNAGNSGLSNIGAFSGAHSASGAFGGALGGVASTNNFADSKLLGHLLKNENLGGALANSGSASFSKSSAFASSSSFASASASSGSVSGHY